MTTKVIDHQRRREALQGIKDRLKEARERARYSTAGEGALSDALLELTEIVAATL